MSGSENAFEQDAGRASPPPRPRISVCMAVYNGAKYLRPQLESILSQIGAEDELVIVDDCSTDTTRHLLEHVDDARVKVLRHDANRGPVKAFERALEAAQGELIFFSDQDDVWLPGKVERTLEAFARTPALAVVTDARVVESEGEPLLDSYFAWRESGPGLVKNFVKNSYLGCCMAIRRECKAFLLPFPPLVAMHDVWAGLACELAGQTHFLPQRLVVYRRHEGNYSNMKRAAWWRILARRLTLLLSLLQRLPRLAWWRLSRHPLSAPHGGELA